MTVGELIRHAYIAAGMADPRQALAPELAQYGWDKLDDLIDLMKTNRLLMYRRQRVGPFNITAGLGDITATAPILIGSGAPVMNTPRPVWIDGAGVIYTAGSTPRPELSMHIFTVKQWREVVVKGITSTLSRALIYDQNFDASGYGAIYLYPVPSAAFQIVLYVPQTVAAFPLDANGNPDFTTVIALPPSYRPMLISQLAIIVSIGVSAVSADLEKYAERALSAVMASNVVQTMDPVSCDPATRASDNNATGWDWIGGGFN